MNWFLRNISEWLKVWLSVIDGLILATWRGFAGIVPVLSQVGSVMTPPLMIWRDPSIVLPGARSTTPLTCWATPYIIITLARPPSILPTNTESVYWLHWSVRLHHDCVLYLRCITTTYLCNTEAIPPAPRSPSFCNICIHYNDGIFPDDYDDGGKFSSCSSSSWRRWQVH